MSKATYNAETRTGTTETGMRFSITPVSDEKGKVEFNIQPEFGPIIGLPSLGEAVERAKGLRQKRVVNVG